MTGLAFPKPIKGASLVKSRERRQSRVSAEQAVMRQAKHRDGNKCRWHGCEFASKKLPIDACHMKLDGHRGIGGNPSGSRTTTRNIVALCRMHHGLYDAALIDLEPLTNDGADSILAFYAKDAESGLVLCVGVEKMR